MYYLLPCINFAIHFYTVKIKLKFLIFRLAFSIFKVRMFIAMSLHCTFFDLLDLLVIDF